MEKELSTPHGALGTKSLRDLFRTCRSSFNSTRCIRNWAEALYPQNHPEPFQLHTVHQELYYRTPHGYARLNGFQLHTVHQELEYAQRSFRKHFITFNSTRCIRNQRGRIGELVDGIGFQLHTVHQEQCKSFFFQSFSLSFNSTRCIRNKGVLSIAEKLYELSTPHGALGTIHQSSL